MKNLKRIVPLVMAGVMLASPVSISAQAKDVDNNKKESAQTTVTARAYSSPAYIRGSDVAFRRTPGLSGEIMMFFQNNTSIQVDKSKTEDVDDIFWYACRYRDKNGNYTYGYVAAKYVYIIPT